jgi:hypothetical protein
MGLDIRKFQLAAQIAREPLNHGQTEAGTAKSVLIDVALGRKNSFIGSENGRGRLNDSDAASETKPTASQPGTSAPRPPSTGQTAVPTSVSSR